MPTADLISRRDPATQARDAIGRQLSRRHVPARVRGLRPADSPCSTPSASVRDVRTTTGKRRNAGSCLTRRHKAKPSSGSDELTEQQVKSVAETAKSDVRVRRRFRRESRPPQGRPRGAARWSGRRRRAGCAARAPSWPGGIAGTGGRTGIIRSELRVLYAGANSRVANPSSLYRGDRWT